MRFGFTPDQELLRDGLRDVLKKECPPALVRASWEKRDAADGLWKTLAELGFVGLTTPEEHGGMGLGALDWVLLFEECGRFCAPVPLLETMAVAVPLIVAHGSEALKSAWLGKIAKGEVRVAVALEPRDPSPPSPLSRKGRGGDRADELPSPLAGEGTGVRVRDADLFLVLKGDALVAVARDEATLREEISVDRSRRLFSLSADDTRGVDGLLPNAPLAASAELLGLSSRMLEMTVDYAKVRKQFGSAIGSFQAVKHHLASALVKIELARPAVYRAAHSVAHADPSASVHVSMAKACASDAATFTARAALQCHGAIGYSFEHDLHLWMKRAWALAAAYGDAPFHRERVARSLLDNRTRSSATATTVTGDSP